ncbi:hypothetical protein TGME49_267980 [Toxoplasma gondii ME49]|uniref:Transmembrane protein n=1 Tax=Toxoplasma gondii (strain ATCC 50611 / Me49) TaxID=508771 RepID=S8GID4_TOXGM|nr:hypothetical protein TGME49_267980 [Toxoplasma gondii ME49]EPT28209.1 hypothetical protein TGME49_267980 [Toxoplasma gondii ME49]|eukprot:XP_002365515.1 hypothetical protein TGME49_267980 [Toxoplasma gondii ME49]
MFARRYSVHKGALRVSRCALEDLKKAFCIFSSLNLFLFLTMAPGLSHFLLLLVAGLAYFGKESTVWALRYQAAGDWNPLTDNAPELASDPVENADEPSSRIQSFVEASKDNSSSGGDRDKGEGDKSPKGIGERLRNFFFVRKSGSGTSKGNRDISESHLGTPGKYTQKGGSSSTTSLRGAGGGKKETPAGKKETPTDKKETPTDKKETPAAKKETPEDKKETPTGKKETPEDKKETPAGKKETPAGKKETPADEKPESSDKQTTAQLIDSLSKQMIIKLNYVDKELTGKVLPDDKPNAEAINSDLHLVAIDYKYEVCNILQEVRELEKDPKLKPKQKLTLAATADRATQALDMLKRTFDEDRPEYCTDL